MDPWSTWTPAALLTMLPGMSAVGNSCSRTVSTFAAAVLDESSGVTTDSASWLGNTGGDQFAATLLILSPF